MPDSVVYIAVGVYKSPFATRLVQLPHAVVLGAIRPSHHARAMSETTSPLTRVHGTRFVGVLAGHQGFSWIVNLFRQCFFVLIDLKVFSLVVHFHAVNQELLTLLETSDKRLYL